MTDSEAELCKAIIAEDLEIIKDESFPVEFREQVRWNLVHIKDEIDRILIQYGVKP